MRIPVSVVAALLFASALTGCSSSDAGTSTSTGGASGTTGHSASSSGSGSGSGTSTGGGTTGSGVEFTGPEAFTAHNWVFDTLDGEDHYPDAGPILTGFVLQMSTQDTNADNGDDCSPDPQVTLLLTASTSDAGAAVGLTFPIQSVQGADHASCQLTITTQTGDHASFTASSGTLAIDGFTENVAGHVVSYEMTATLDAQFPLSDGGSLEMTSAIDLANAAPDCP